jgi:hypothetical protein
MATMMSREDRTSSFFNMAGIFAKRPLVRKTSRSRSERLALQNLCLGVPHQQSTEDSFDDGE